MMKVSNAYFKHPITGEIIKPGEMYQDFDKRATVVSALNPRSDAEGAADGEDKADKEQQGAEKPLSDCTLTELKAVAKDLKIEGYSKMNKDELFAVISALREGAIIHSTTADRENAAISDVI